MKYTQDWFSHNIGNFQHIKGELKTVNHILEIGCFEGRATCWMLENMLSHDGDIIVIDTFAGSAEHGELDLTDMRKTFEDNVAEVRKETQNLTALQMPSYEGLSALVGDGLQGYFDFIYVDGSHTAPDVLTDACMAFGLLRQGGVMLFDDYMWMAQPGILNQPKIAIDAFTTIFSNQSIIRMTGYQLAIQKV